MDDDPYARFYTMDSDFEPPKAPPRMGTGGYGAPPTVKSSAAVLCVATRLVYVCAYVRRRTP